MPQRSLKDELVQLSNSGAATRHVPVSVFSVAEARRLEAAGLLDACQELHRDGVLEDHEYDVKYLAFVDGLAVAERGDHR